MAALTDKQKLFIKEYLVDFNATRAAIACGYSKKTAASQSSRLLTNVKIQEAISKATKKHVESVGLTVEEVLEGIRYIYTKNKDEDPRTAISALTLAGKYHSLFIDRVDHSGEISMPNIKITK